MTLSKTQIENIRGKAINLNNPEYKRDITLLSEHIILMNAHISELNEFAITLKKSLQEKDPTSENVKICQLFIDKINETGIL